MGQPMKAIILAMLFSAGAAGAAPAELYPQRSTAPIVIVWPPEGLTLHAGAQGEFILGSVSEPRAILQINGQTANVSAKGAFLSWLPVTPGTFTFDCSLALPEGTTTFRRSIIVPITGVTLPAKPLAIDEASLQPKGDLDLRPGDWLTVRMRASPGQPAQYRLAKRPAEPMKETSPGLYEASWLVEASDKLEPTSVDYQLGKGWGAVKAQGRSKVAFTSLLQTAVVRSTSPIRAGPGNGYMLFPLPGTKLLIAGRWGTEARVVLSPAHEGWIAAKDIEVLPGVPAPRAVTGAINTSAGEGATAVRISLTERVPFEVEEAADLKGLTVRLFTTVAHSNWIVYDSNDAFIEEIRWRQESAGVVAITIRLAEGQSLWGWNPSFEGQSLRLDLRRPPVLSNPPGSVFSGVKIMLDPGHMPSATGATGPLGTREMDANYAIARAVEALLSREGAYPSLTRDTTSQEVSLVDRPRLAVERGVDLFLSLHNNALPDGENPFSRSRGFSVFYYHPHSMALGREVYRSYLKRVPLAGEELRYGDLLVARLSAMPAILVESAYMILPAQEEKLNDPVFRGTLAKAVIEGLRSLLEAERKRQQAVLKTFLRKSR